MKVALRLHILDRSGGAQCLLFSHIGQMYPKGAAIPKILLDHPRQIAHAENNIVDAMRLQVAKDMLYKWSVGDRLHWFWPMDGQWPQAGSLTPHQNNCFHVELLRYVDKPDS